MFFLFISLFFFTRRENQPATKKTGQTKKMVNARRMGKKPKGGKGVRNPSKKAGGRKRR